MTILKAIGLLLIYGGAAGIIYGAGQVHPGLGWVAFGALGILMGRSFVQ